MIDAIDRDPAYVVRNVDGRELAIAASIPYLIRSRDAWMKGARFARECAEKGIDGEYYRHQVAVRVGLAREAHHKLLAVLRHQRGIGVQAVLPLDSKETEQ